MTQRAWFTTNNASLRTRSPVAPRPAASGRALGYVARGLSARRRCEGGRTWLVRRERELADLLEEVGLFSRCSRRERATVARHMQTASLPAGTHDGRRRRRRRRAVRDPRRRGGRAPRRRGRCRRSGPAPTSASSPCSTASRAARPSSAPSRSRSPCSESGMFRTLLREFPDMTAQVLAGLAQDLRRARRARGRDPVHRLVSAPTRRQLGPDGGARAARRRECDVRVARRRQARAFVARTLEPVNLPGGAHLMREGEAGDSLFFVAVGRLRVTMTRDDGTEAARGRARTRRSRRRARGDDQRAAVRRRHRAARQPGARALGGGVLELVAQFPDALRGITTQVVRRLVRSFREGSPTSPVVTIAVVPLSDDPSCHRVRGSAARRRSNGSPAPPATSRSAETTAALGDLGRVGADRLASWFGEREARVRGRRVRGRARAERVDRSLRAPGRPRAARRRRRAKTRRHEPWRARDRSSARVGCAPAPNSCSCTRRGRRSSRHPPLARRRPHRRPPSPRARRPRRRRRPGRRVFLIGRGIGVVFSGGGARGHRRHRCARRR